LPFDIKNKKLSNTLKVTSSFGHTFDSTYTSTLATSRGYIGQGYEFIVVQSLPLEDIISDDDEQ